MEIFKTSDSIGAWHYPGDSIIRIGNVPLFSGFMYSAVGSYISHVWKIFDFRFNKFPPMLAMFIVAAAIYVNVFSHHYIWDFRYPILAVIGIMLSRTWVYYKIYEIHRRMPLLLALLLISLFIWFAENIATYCKVWFYPSQNNGWTLVSPSKITAWFLLMFISFVLIAAIRKIKTPNESLHWTEN